MFKIKTFAIAAAAMLGPLCVAASANATLASFSLTLVADTSAYDLSQFSGAQVKFLGDYDAASHMFTIDPTKVPLGTFNGYGVLGVSTYGVASNQFNTSAAGPLVDYAGVSVVFNHLIAPGVYEEGNFFTNPGAILGPQNVLLSHLSDGNDTSTQFHVAGFGTVGGVPEPTSWAMMIGGFGLIGVMRRRTPQALAA